jgi:hypothetical protein
MTKRKSTDNTNSAFNTSLRMARGGNGKIPTIHELMYGENKLIHNIAAKNIFI